mmetsp:Transcript_19091/g.38460  ORF Transcript_19091/g.38460 Transcript_19091/m.38460 type:complete len:80 (-) Transcript_19091:740-979(-)
MVLEYRRCIRCLLTKAIRSTYHNDDYDLTDLDESAGGGTIPTPDSGLATVSISICYASSICSRATDRGADARRWLHVAS